MISSQSVNLPTTGKAELAFREAYERLKQGKPKILPKGTQVSQNNVARESGTDPSALRKSRYPELINEIQRWINQNQPDATSSARQKNLSQRKKNRSLKEVIAELKSQRDNAASLLVEADAKILELTMENTRLLAILPQNNINLLRRTNSSEDC